MKDQVKITLPASWEPKKTVDAGPEPVIYLGIKETLDVLDVFAEGAKAYEAAKADGAITLADAPKFLSTVMKVPAALNNISSVPAELLSVDLDDADDVIAAVVEKFNITAETAKHVVKNAIIAVVAIKNIVTALV
jgi:hypothetical protein